MTPTDPRTIILVPRGYAMTSAVERMLEERGMDWAFSDDVKLELTAEEQLLERLFASPAERVYEIKAMLKEEPPELDLRCALLRQDHGAPRSIRETMRRPKREKRGKRR